MQTHNLIIDVTLIRNVGYLNIFNLYSYRVSISQVALSFTLYKIWHRAFVYPIYWPLSLKASNADCM